ncbi:hypothetical protein F2P44_12565 [Massilia sp. CCM 8695]|uniref:TubC N-terminal docking domain-containing protein n=1 Tax=Massilia frigida TaxID=2609281 RepID=A0ABX0NBE7_9BURK|nr:hypothetical protein [Massilia frigida]NHZ80104.1 hypothetical protein [Massilia frigida]
MNPQALIDSCKAVGVSVHLAGDGLKLRGTAEAVNAVSAKVRANKAALLAHLSASSAIDLVAEFMEVDGLTRTEAEAMAAISVQPRTPAVWLGLIAELNTLIATYCDSAQVSQEAKQRLHAVAASQSLASIPTAIEWFRAELRTLNASTLLKAQND